MLYRQLTILYAYHRLLEASLDLEAIDKPSRVNMATGKKWLIALSALHRRHGKSKPNNLLQQTDLIVEQHCL